MGKSPRTKVSIMTPDEERFMAFEGLVQWTQTVVMQSARVSAAQNSQFTIIESGTTTARRQAILAFHSECHFFVIAAHKLLEFRDWVLMHRLCGTTDFTEINQFSQSGIRNLRNMREHVLDYFQGYGRMPDGWLAGAPEFNADASSVVGTKIGGMLDWVAFGAAAERLMPQLLAQPIPYPVTKTFPGMMPPSAPS